jgi:hypothetical protein
MKTIRSTGLNYFIQDTPFSTYVTIRKSIIKLRTKILNRTDEEPEPNPEEDFKYESLKLKMRHSSRNMLSFSVITKI